MMSTIYLLWYERETATGEEDNRLIGVYSTEDSAKQAIVRPHEKPGFRDQPDGFRIYTSKMDYTDWREEFVDVLPEEM